MQAIWESDWLALKRSQTSCTRLERSPVRPNQKSNLVGAAEAGSAPKAVKAAAQRYGYAKAYTDWRDMIADPDVQVFDNGGPNDAHAEPTIAAAQAGKHVFCEKPLARTAEEAKSEWQSDGGSDTKSASM